MSLRDEIGLEDSAGGIRPHSMRPHEAHITLARDVVADKRDAGEDHGGACHAREDP